MNKRFTPFVLLLALLPYLLAATAISIPAPQDATYITQTANGILSGEQALSSLSTGLVKVTTGTGVLSTGTLGSDYIANSSIDTSAELAAILTDETGTGNVVFNTSPGLVTPNLGTPSAGTLTSCTGLPIATGVSGLGTGIGTFLGTPSSANLASAITNETGSGALVFGTSPALTTPDIGAATGTSLTVADTSGLLFTSGGANYKIAWVGGVGVNFFEGGSSTTAISNGVTLGSARALGWSSTAAPGNAIDVGLFRDAANTLAQRNGTNAQRFNIYATYTDASNWADGFIAMNLSGTDMWVGTQAAGSGTAGKLALVSAGTVRWNLATSGHILAQVDNTYDIGATGATRPRSVYVGTSISTPSIDGGALSKTLTESSATNFVQIAVASSSRVGGCIHYTVHANDATDFQARSGSVNFALVNKAGTETATLGTVINEAAAVSTGTLTVAFTADTSPTNAVNIQANAVSSLTQTTLAITYWVEIFGPSTTVTPQ